MFNYKSLWEGSVSRWFTVLGQTVPGTFWEQVLTAEEQRRGREGTKVKNVFWAPLVFLAVSNLNVPGPL